MVALPVIVFNNVITSRSLMLNMQREILYGYTISKLQEVWEGPYIIVEKLNDIVCPPFRGDNSQEA